MNVSGYTEGKSYGDLKNTSTPDLIAECYIGFQKLLSTELRNNDRRDSFIF